MTKSALQSEIDEIHEMLKGIPVDIRGKTFRLGQEVAVGAFRAGTACITIRKVTHIQDGNVYLDDSKVAINFPERLAIIEPQ